MSRNQSVSILSRMMPAKPAIGVLGALVCASVAVTAPVPAMAQDNAEARLRRAEAEIRALQRAVFPGGDGRFFEPQISADGPQTTVTRPNTAPSTTAVTDILARLDAIELQLQRLTARTEENSNALGSLAERLTALEVSAAEAAAAAEAQQAAEAQTEEPAQTASTESNLEAMTGGASSTEETAEAEAPVVTTAGPSPDRLAAVQEITKPQTDDEGDDEYTYGFRLWNGGFYPEARQQLAKFIEEYPDHSRITYGRNLLGRAFLDDGMPEEAARWFLRNYQADRTARRAPDSLLFLAESMIVLEDNRRACIALAEFGDTYPAVATGRLADQYESNRRRVNCEEG